MSEFRDILSRLSEDLSVMEEGQKYEVHLPCGTDLTIEPQFRLINLGFEKKIHGYDITAVDPKNFAKSYGKATDDRPPEEFGSWDRDNRLKLYVSVEALQTLRALAALLNKAATKQEIDIVDAV